jgi:PAS domain S-box-containing protein
MVLKEAMRTESAVRRTSIGSNVPDFEDFFENGAIGLHIVDGNGIILRANKAELAMLGYRAEEYVGRSITEFHADEPVIQDILNRLTRGEKLDRYPARLKAKDGSVKDVLITSSALFQDGRFINTRCFTIDVTATRMLEEQLATERKKSEQEQALLVRELHHRVKNTLATVQAIMSTTMRFSSSMEDFQKSFVGRVAALAKTHALITDHRTQTINFLTLLENELLPFDDGSGRIIFDGPESLLPAHLAAPLSMAIHELTTNAVKYGALSIIGGTLQVEWKQNSDQLSIEWTESNVPDIKPPESGGFGKQLLTRVLPQQLNATVNIHYEPDGLHASICVPLSVPEDN